MSCSLSQPLPSPPYLVATVEGGQAELPCDITSGPGARDSVYLVLWYRKDSGTPIYRSGHRLRSTDIIELEN